MERAQQGAASPVPGADPRGDQGRGATAARGGRHHRPRADPDRQGDGPLRPCFPPLLHQPRRSAQLPDQGRLRRCGGRVGPGGGPLGQGLSWRTGAIARSGGCAPRLGGRRAPPRSAGPGRPGARPCGPGRHMGTGPRGAGPVPPALRHRQSRTRRGVHGGRDDRLARGGQHGGVMAVPVRAGGGGRSGRGGPGGLGGGGRGAGLYPVVRLGEPGGGPASSPGWHLGAARCWARAWRCRRTRSGWGEGGAGAVRASHRGPARVPPHTMGPPACTSHDGRSPTPTRQPHLPPPQSCADTAPNRSRMWAAASRNSGRPSVSL